MLVIDHVEVRRLISFVVAWGSNSASCCWHRGWPIAVRPRASAGSSRQRHSGQAPVIATQREKKIVVASDAGAYRLTGLAPNQTRFAARGSASRPSRAISSRRESRVGVGRVAVRGDQAHRVGTRTHYEPMHPANGRPKAPAPPTPRRTMRRFRAQRQAAKDCSSTQWSTTPQLAVAQRCASQRAARTGSCTNGNFGFTFGRRRARRATILSAERASRTITRHAVHGSIAAHSRFRRENPPVFFAV